MICCTLAFSGQILCDFLGYSTCAVGAGMCLGFALPEALFALVLENGWNIDTGSTLDLLIGIVERHAQRLRQVFANRGFASPHGTDEKDSVRFSHGRAC